MALRIIRVLGEGGMGPLRGEQLEPVRRRARAELVSAGGTQEVVAGSDRAAGARGHGPLSRRSSTRDKQRRPALPQELVGRTALDYAEGIGSRLARGEMFS